MLGEPTPPPPPARPVEPHPGPQRPPLKCAAPCPVRASDACKARQAAAVGSTPPPGIRRCSAVLVSHAGAMLIDSFVVESPNVVYTEEHIAATYRRVPALPHQPRARCRAAVSALRGAHAPPSCSAASCRPGCARRARLADGPLGQPDARYAVRSARATVCAPTRGLRAGCRSGTAAVPHAAARARQLHQPSALALGAGMTQLRCARTRRAAPRCGRQCHRAPHTNSARGAMCRSWGAAPLREQRGSHDATGCWPPGALAAAVLVLWRQCPPAPRGPPLCRAPPPRPG